MRVGPFELEHPFILAPMAGITHSAYRRMMRRLQSSCVVSELVSASGIQYGGQKTLELLQYHEEERKVGLQIFGEDTETLCQAAQFVESKGADFVDLNMGCPVPKVVKKGGGAALCRDPIALEKILSAMVKSIKIPLTIKIRTGWDADSKNALDVVKAATDAGVAWVAIHGRTRAQGYSGDADWDFIGNIKAKSSIPIIGNGDLVSAELAVERFKTYGVDAVLIGRGALRNPFIFEQAKDLLQKGTYSIPNAEKYMQTINLLKSLLEDCYPFPRLSMLHSKKFLAWFSAGFPGCHEFRSKVFAFQDGTLLWEEAFRFFEKTVSERDMKFLQQPFLMGGHG